MSEDSFVPRKLQIFFFKNNSSVKIKNRTLCFTPTLYAFPYSSRACSYSHIYDVLRPFNFLLDFVSRRLTFFGRLNVLPALGGERVDSWQLRFSYFTINKGFICPYFVHFCTQTSFFPFSSPLLFPCFVLSLYPYSLVPCHPISCYHLFVSPALMPCFLCRLFLCVPLCIFVSPDIQHIMSPHDS